MDGQLQILSWSNPRWLDYDEVAPKQIKLLGKLDRLRVKIKQAYRINTIAYYVPGAPGTMLLKQALSIIRNGHVVYVRMRLAQDGPWKTHEILALKRSKSR